MRRVALACGVNQFGHLPEATLYGCVNDARNMAEVFSRLGCETTVLVNQQVTKQAVFDWFEKARRLRPSYVAFSFSSHGTHWQDLTEPDLLGEALCCYDLRRANGDWDTSGLILDDELQLWLSRFPQETTVELWLDTCYSGGMDRRLRSRPKFLHNPANRDGLLRFASPRGRRIPPNVVLWAACSEGETAQDTVIDGQWTGAFTWWWLNNYHKRPRAARVDLIARTRVSLRGRQFPRLKCWNAKAHTTVGS